MGEYFPYPRMMYGEWPVYKVALDAEHEEELKKLGYVRESWADHGKPKEEVKSNKCGVCGRRLDKFSHVRCADGVKAAADVVE